MNSDEVRIVDFLNEFPDEFVSVTEISKKLGKGRRYKEDRTWARPVLRRMEMDGLLESNPSGDYRLKLSNSKAIDFKQALKKPTPGVSLGDTTIIKLSDIQEQGTASRNEAVGQ